MPVSCKLIDGKWRLCGPDGKPETNVAGTAIDGGGHGSEGACQKQAGAVNANLSEKASVEDMTIRGYQFEDASFRAYAAKPETWNEDEGSFEAVAATQNPVIVWDQKSKRAVREILRMDGVLLPKDGQLPLQDTHQRGSIRNLLGSMRNVHIEDGKLVGRNFISAAEPAARTKVKERHLRDNSLGYVVHGREILEAGIEREVAGVVYRAEGNLPLQISTRWTPMENSLLPIGADEAAKVRGSMWGLRLEGKAMADEIKPEEKPAEKPAETPKADETKVEPPVVARRDQLAEITPRGWEAMLDAAVIDGLGVEDYQKRLREELAKRQKPVGTPEPKQPEPKKDGLEKVSDAQFKRLF